MSNTDIKSYKDLIIWQRSMDLVEFVYLITEGFPAKENFGLVLQMRRSVIRYLPILPKVMEGNRKGVIHSSFL